MTFNFIALFLGNLRGWEIIIILIVVLLLFGGKRIPQLMRSVGQGIRGFKEGLSNIQDEINSPVSKQQGESCQHHDGKKPN